MSNPLTHANTEEHMSEHTLLVFAHSDEATAFVTAGVPHVLTGVGKINATIGLLTALYERGIDDIERVIVLGTAGVIADGPKLDRVYQIDAAVQHDFSLPSPRLETHGEHITETATIATGDVFVMSDEQRTIIAQLGATLVDMESYAYASVCERLGIDLHIFKAPSDFADDTTTDEEWDTVVFSKSDQLLAFAREHLPELFV